MTRWIALGLLFVSTVAGATTWRSPDDVPEFRGWRQVLQHRVDDFATTRGNHFCVVVRTRPGQDGPDVKALVHWVEGHSLSSYVGVPDVPMSADTLFGPDMIDLDRGVVARADQIRGSASAVTRAYVRHVLAKCHTVGVRVVFRKGGGR